MAHIAFGNEQFSEQKSQSGTERCSLPKQSGNPMETRWDSGYLLRNDPYNNLWEYVRIVLNLLIVRLRSYARPSNMPWASRFKFNVTLNREKGAPYSMSSASDYKMNDGFDYVLALHNTGDEPFWFNSLLFDITQRKKSAFQLLA